MRYPKDHGQQTRRRIVENASYGLRQNGADGLSVVDLMKLADLTHGSFYAYFKSRDALVVEAFALAMDQTVTHWLDLTQGLSAAKGFGAIVESYVIEAEDPAHALVLAASDGVLNTVEYPLDVPVRLAAGSAAANPDRSGGRRE